jgi:hypothetical protein
VSRTRRLLWFVAIAGPLILLAVRTARARSATSPPAPVWPPIETAKPAAVETPVPTPSVSPEPVTAPSPDGERWIAAVDGTCPTTHPVKAGRGSRIYHLPGGRHYDRTRAERCYADAAEAEADGYRAAKDPAAGRQE